MRKLIEQRFEQQIDNLSNLMRSSYIEQLENGAKLVVDTIRRGNKILVAGNGGSAADSQYFAAECIEEKRDILHAAASGLV